MTVFRVFLATCLLIILAYTGVTVANEGPNLFPTFFGDMTAMGWAGQFNLDFFCILLLSALWTAWRNDFKPTGLILAVVAFFGGMTFLSVYLLILTSRPGATMATVMLGARRAGA